MRDWPEREVCKLLALRVRRHRVGAGLSQQAFALKAQIPLRTYKRFELDGKATLETFVQVLRVLGRTQFLPLLFPTALPQSSSTFEGKLARLKALAAQRAGGSRDASG
ncbi:helix-turn-helix transcriptional regulator [Mitsuaria sp. TWR114]|uniref:helix-turn-helix domain-containing protein n=1 Tax=Mitsuaria sp. TWR114 TaxID=2601731 RepID=UPI00164B6FB8|nr:helix-turn-helix transcriptional regulator [Mitsuaria sp. TWR114]